MPISGEPSPPDGHVGGLSVPPPALFQLPGQHPSACSCQGPLPQVAQPVDKTQTLRLDEGGGEVPSYGWRQDNNNSMEIRGPLASTKEHQK